MNERMTTRELTKMMNSSIRQELAQAKALAATRKAAAATRQEQCAIANAITAPLPMTAWLHYDGARFYAALTVSSLKTDAQLTAMLQRAIDRGFEITSADWGGEREFTVRMSAGYALLISARVSKDAANGDCRIVEEKRVEEYVTRRIVCS